MFDDFGSGFDDFNSSINDLYYQQDAMLQDLFQQQTDQFQQHHQFELMRQQQDEFQQQVTTEQNQSLFRRIVDFIFF